MTTKEIINGKIFIAQTTFYCYNSEDDYSNNKWSLSTSSEMAFEEMKRTNKQ